ncbi:GTP 3',8-cyclase [Fistulifera solaris]|uniref:GTP 3',8-cyclase n=1 Tax=Fistulifera solaris TaxID=1519565 RepID=A0A1Z5J6I2_FISSO|nr:GTP 3',8-cyclase [Fistulifera solaris]|eukprot:GAX09428.1 GTP 3',8-cyclase [Fistulifera solaris]
MKSSSRTFFSSVWKSSTRRRKSSVAVFETQSIEEFPRLQALREQLQRDQPVIHRTKQRLTTLQPTDDTVQLREWIDTLPLPTTILQDSYGRFHNYLRLSLVERCNLRCTYCMPPEGIPLSDNLLTSEEVLRLAAHFVSRGVNKFRLTGGEPTLRKDLTEIIQGLHALRPKQIGITTNGVVLTRKLNEFIDAGLTSINISLDTLQADKFEQLTRRPYFTKVWESIVAAHQAASEQAHLTVKVNCVVMRGVNDEEVPNFIKLTEQFPHLQMRFIEYMPFSSNGWDWSKCVPYQELLTDDLTPVPSPDPSDTTKWYQTPTGATVGFITSMSEHFCGSCNRIRLTADGQLKVCLFDGREVNLKNVLRLPDVTEQDLDKVIYHALQHKQKQLGGHPDPASIKVDNNRPMTLIGG